MRKTHRMMLITVVLLFALLISGVFVQAEGEAAEKLHEFQTTSDTGWLRCVGFSNDGKFVAIGARNGSPKRAFMIFDVETCEMIFNGLEHEGEIHYISWSSDDKYIATASFDGTIKIWEWNGKDAKVIQTLQPRGGTEVECAVFSPDGAYLYSYDRMENVTKWDTSKWSMVKFKRTGGGESGGRILSVSSDGKTLAVVSYGNFGAIPTTEIWDADTLDTLKQFSEDKMVWIRDIKLSPDGKYLGVVGDIEGSLLGAVTVWDVAAGKRIGEVYGDVADPSFGRLYQVGWSADSKYMATSARPVYDEAGNLVQDTGFLYVWNPETMDVVFREPIIGNPIGFAWSPNGEYFAGTTTSRYVQIWKWLK